MFLAILNVDVHDSLPNFALSEGKNLSRAKKSSAGK
jgi:hypothetical protein